MVGPGDFFFNLGGGPPSTTTMASLLTSVTRLNWVSSTVSETVNSTGKVWDTQPKSPTEATLGSGGHT